MKTAFRITSALLALVSLGFCVAFALDAMIARSKEQGREIGVSSSGSNFAQVVDSEDASSRPASSWKGQVDERKASAAAAAEEETRFVDLLFDEDLGSSRLLLASVLPKLPLGYLEHSFAELMARDLEDARSIEFAGRTLQELARRRPELAVALLSSLAPAEKAKLVPSLARGWVTAEAASAFDWIDTAWIDPDGNYIDRDLQNQLYIAAIDTLLTETRDFEDAARRVESFVDPDLKRTLIDLVARRVVADGPESALERMSASRSDAMDASILDAVAAEWSARDPLGAMQWSLDNQGEVSAQAARTVAKQLLLNQQRGSLDAFHSGMSDVAKRDSVASEAARLLARREPVHSADWVLAIESPSAKYAAVQAALFEIGYERFDASVDYIDFVYAPEEPERSPVVFAALKDWASIDPVSVQTYLRSGRSGLAPELSREILDTARTL